MALVIGTLVTVAAAISLETLYAAEARQFWGEKTGHNDESDAFRHAYVSARFAQEFGEFAPNMLGLIHELTHPSDDSRDGSMDIWNNLVGSKIGEKNKLEDASYIADEVRKAIRDGRLITDYTKDPRVNHANDASKLSIDPKTKTWWDQAQNWLPRRDPLTFDLDGDGIETVGASNTRPILFDHDGDGTKNGTGWVKSDDALLVLDRNGNGTIDNGRELFGDNTIKSNGKTAVDGFDALADLDSNHDGKISNLDTQFNNLKLWRDLNQDGISQSNELFSLTSQNIVSINITKTANSQALGNGNQLADLGSFTKADGSTGTVGEVSGDMADINLAHDTFHRSFPNKLDTSNVSNLPDMQGSGVVRDLREAATQSTRLQSLLTQYAAATTGAAQIALIDQLLDAWADTGGFKESYVERVPANDEVWRLVG